MGRVENRGISGIIMLSHRNRMGSLGIGQEEEEVFEWLMARRQLSLLLSEEWKLVAWLGLFQIGH